MSPLSCSGRKALAADHRLSVKFKAGQHQQSAVLQQGEGIANGVAAYLRHFAYPLVIAATGIQLTGDHQQLPILDILLWELFVCICEPEGTIFYNYQAFSSQRSSSLSIVILAKKALCIHKAFSPITKYSGKEAVGDPTASCTDLYDQKPESLNTKTSSADSSARVSLMTTRMLPSSAISAAANQG